MLRRLSFTLSLPLVAILAMAPATLAEGTLTGEMNLEWNACYGAPPSEEVPDWIGTVEFDDVVYDILFFNVGTGRPPTLPPLEPPMMSASEIWAIYDGLELVYDDECAIETFEGDIVLWGHDYGEATLPDFVLNGTVIEASGDFANLAGHDVTISGTVELTEDGAPLAAPGEFVIG